MREDAVSDKFFYRVIEIYCAAERDLLRDAFECTKGRPPQSDSELDDRLATDEGKLATMFAPGPTRCGYAVFPDLPQGTTRRGGLFFKTFLPNC